MLCATPAVSSEAPRSKATTQTGSSTLSSAYLNTGNGAAGITSSGATASASLQTPGLASVAAPSVGNSTGTISGGPSDEGTSSVQFMWQPLSDINYPSITLLASFKVTSVLPSSQSPGHSQLFNISPLNSDVSVNQAT